jgi:hypothetical protein
MAERRGRPVHGRPSRRGSSSRLRTTVLAAGGAPGPTPSDLSTSLDPRIATRATYRGLVRTGLSTEQAADLTAFLCGLPIGEVHWTLGQLNRLLFYRALDASGRFGPDDGAPAGMPTT